MIWFELLAVWAIMFLLYWALIFGGSSRRREGKEAARDLTKPYDKELGFDMVSEEEKWRTR
jgi:hypothetical protein